MSGRTHDYAVTVEWTGNRGEGTSGYEAYDRDHVLRADGPAPIDASSDPAFRGDGSRWNPEQLFVASIAECHMLWYLHLATLAGLVVATYEDSAIGVMTQDDTGGGEFTEVVLRPRVGLTAGDAATADRLHGEVHRYCFIAQSVTVPIRHEPATSTA